MLRSSWYAILVIVLSGLGCFVVPKVNYRTEVLPASQPTSTQHDSALFGLALSGGGSRAAVFGAAGIEALWEHGVLDDLDYISSVSGGSIAASYYYKKRVVDGQSPSAEFFEDYLAQMRFNYWKSVEWRQFYKFRWLSSIRRANSLREVLDRQFLDGLTLGDLDGSRPRLLVNTSLYNNGRRFVITTVGQAELEIDFSEIDGIGSDLAGRPAIQPMTFYDEQMLGALPPDFPLSLGVAASASVPLLIGPVTLKVGTTYWHVGDGGLFDNTGIETLQHLLLNKLAGQQRTDSALILALDSGRRVDGDELASEKDFWISGHPDLVVDIAMGRAETYHQAVWHQLSEHTIGTRLEQIILRYTAAEIGPDQLPESCRSTKGLCNGQDCAESITRYIRAIPTHLKIKDCDADLIELAAHLLVHAEWSGRTASRVECRFGSPADY